MSELDLLARIRAQQGRLADAEALWMRACQLAPDDERIARALRRVRNRRGGRTAMRGIFIVAVVLIAFRAGMLLPRPVDVAPETPPDVGTAPPDPLPSLRVPGLRTHQDGSMVTAEFERPPFAGAAQLTAEAKTSLARVAEQLRDAENVHIVVRGHADSVPVSRWSRYRDNEDVALARAAAAARQLEDSGLPASVLSIRSAVDRVASAAQAPEKRTVVLYVMKRKGGHGQ